jgi:hypothetical protein
MKIFTIFFALSILFNSCALKEDAVMPYGNDLIIEYNFENGTQSWAGNFCDYEKTLPDETFRFNFSHAALPDSMKERKNALKFSFDNKNGDLFAYTTAPYDNLIPEMLYEASFQVEIATQYPVLGAGDAVFVKAGVTTSQPFKTLYGNFWGINVLKGNNGKEGEQMFLLGTASAPLNNNKYQMIYLKSARPHVVQADKNGRVWMIMGFDSQYAAPTELYVSKIRVYFRAID